MYESEVLTKKNLLDFLIRNGVSRARIVEDQANHTITVRVPWRHMSLLRYYLGCVTPMGVVYHVKWLPFWRFRELILMKEI